MEEEVEMTELILEIDYEDEVVPVYQEVSSSSSQNVVVVPFLGELSEGYIQSAYIKLYMLNCEWLIDMEFLSRL